MAFQIRDLLADVWTDEHAGFYLGCEHPSCGKSANDGDDDDDKGGHKGDHGDHKDDQKKGGGKSEPKYAPPVELALLQQQLQQTLALEM
jgi:hypothetical protein